MDTGVADRATESVSDRLQETVRRARLQFDQYQQRLLLERRWAKRHPIYARLLYWPICGERLRARRRRYVNLKLSSPS